MNGAGDLSGGHDVQPGQVGGDGLGVMGDSSVRRAAVTAVWVVDMVSDDEQRRVRRELLDGSLAVYAAGPWELNEGLGFRLGSIVAGIAGARALQTRLTSPDRITDWRVQAVTS